MHYLPPLPPSRFLAEPVWLPLTDASAGQLAAVWLQDDPQRRRQLLADLLHFEPVFVVWSLAQSDSPLNGLHQVVDWFDRHAMQFWLQAAPAAALPKTADQAQLAHWADLSATLRRQLSLAESAAEDHVFPNDFDLLTGLTSWVQVTGPQTSGEREAAPHMPSSSDQPNSNLQRRWHGDSGVCQHWLYDLAAGLNKLSTLNDLEQHFEERLNTEKLRSLKEFAYGASHELNNPLANISTRAQTLLRDESHPERRRMLATINSQAFRANEMIADLMLFAHPPPLHMNVVDLAQIVSRVFSELAELATAQQVQLHCDALEQPITLEADADHLAVALRSLIQNALEALAPGGHVWTTLTCEPTPDEPWIEILVEDDGRGIPPAVAAHMFDPYYSGREAGRGLGLGLSKCWRIVTLHGGSIALAHTRRHSSTTNSGAAFVIRLPRARQPIENREDSGEGE